MNGTSARRHFDKLLSVTEKEQRRGESVYSRHETPSLLPSSKCVSVGRHEYTWTQVCVNSWTRVVSCREIHGILTFAFLESRRDRGNPREELFPIVWTIYLTRRENDKSRILSLHLAAFRRRMFLVAPVDNNRWVYAMHGLEKPMDHVPGNDLLDVFTMYRYREYLSSWRDQCFEIRKIIMYFFYVHNLFDKERERER